MTTASPSAFTIDNDVLQQASPKPHHLEERFKSKSPQVVPLTATPGQRRQSFLEERRSQLAIRNDRVKQVLRRRKQRSAEMRKSMERNQEAVEANRNQLLKSQADECAKRVKRAKEIARKMAQKEEEMVEKRRAELEERLWSTELRRTMLQRIPRSKLLDETAVEIEVIRAQNAVKRVQRWWRRLLMQRFVDAFLKLGLSHDSVSDIPFRKLASLAQHSNTIKITGKLLAHIKKSTHVGRTRRYKNPTKVFLSSYMIAYHAEEIIPEQGDQEKTMLASFDRLLSGNRDQIDFVEHWHKYHIAFESWKKRDTEKLLDEMHKHFLELDRLWETVKDQVDAETVWRPKLRKQQSQIRQKALKIGGKAALSRFGAQDPAVMDLITTADESMSDSRPSSHESVTSSDLRDSNNHGTSQGHKQTLKKVMAEYGSILSNERIAHEIVVDPDYELKPDTKSLEFQVKSVARKAFFDKIRQDYAAGDLSWVEGVVSDIRAMLLTMTSEKGNMHRQLSDLLDVALISQQIANKAFDAPRFISQVTETMLHLCAPMRDQQIRNIPSKPDLVSQIEAILTAISDMKLDLANYRIHSVRPILMQQAVEYERSKFSKALEENRVVLDKTRKWLETGSAKMKEIASQRNPENIDIPENRIRYESVFIDSLLSLIFSNQAISVDSCPETLIMDAERIFKLQNEAQSITVVSSLIMLSRNFFAPLRDDSLAIKSIKESLFHLLGSEGTTLDRISSHLCEFLGKFMESRGSKLSKEQRELVKNMVEKTLSYKDTVYLLISRRLETLVRQKMTRGRTRRESNNGLEAVQEEAEKFARKVIALGNHNRQVYAPWYDQILEEHLAQQ